MLDKNSDTKHFIFVKGYLSHMQKSIKYSHLKLVNIRFLKKFHSSVNISQFYLIGNKQEPEFCHKTFLQHEIFNSRERCILKWNQSELIAPNDIHYKNSNSSFFIYSIFLVKKSIFLVISLENAVPV